jgi:diguanylate cyclase (GGDEF)-like protein
MSFNVVLGVHLSLIATSLLVGLLAIMTFHRRKQSPEASAFGCLMVAAAIYIFGYAGEMSQTTLEGAARWLMFENISLPWMPGLWLLSAFRHNGRRVPAWTLFIIPTIGSIGVFTNHWHGLFYGPMHMVQHGPFLLLEMHRGPIAVLDNCYLLLACSLAPWLYISHFRNSSTLFRRQAIVVIVSSLLPAVSYFVYLAGLSPWQLDIAPLALALSAALFYYGVFRLSTFDLDPMARNLVFKGMRDAVLIVDNKDRLLDFNPAAQSLIPELSDSSVGKPIVTVFERYPLLTDALLSAHSHEITLCDNDTPQYFDLRTFPLNIRGMELGRATILADITAQAHLREELRVHAETDVLTGIANRRRFLQAIDSECDRYNRYRNPFALLLIDIDHFKSVNDLYGHAAGDIILRAVADTLRDCLREIDLLARYGGEEFSILLVETGEDAARQVAEAARLAIALQTFSIDGLVLPITVSVGVAAPFLGEKADSDTLLKFADIALYRAKAKGRNCIVAASENFVPQAANAAWMH